MVVESHDGKCREYECYREDVLISFQDGTQIRIGYQNQHCAVWRIEVEKFGTADHNLTRTYDEEEEVYSDVLEIEAEVESIDTIAPTHPSGY